MIEKTPEKTSIKLELDVGTESFFKKISWAFTLISLVLFGIYIEEEPVSVFFWWLLASSMVAAAYYYLIYKLSNNYFIVDTEYKQLYLYSSLFYYSRTDIVTQLYNLRCITVDSNLHIGKYSIFTESAVVAIDKDWKLIQMTNYEKNSFEEMKTLAVNLAKKFEIKYLAPIEEHQLMLQKDDESRLYFLRFDSTEHTLDKKPEPLQLWNNKKNFKIFFFASMPLLAIISLLFFYFYS